MCDSNHSYVWRAYSLCSCYEWRQKSTRSHVWYDSFIRVTFSFIRMPWHIHACVTDLFSPILLWEAPKKDLFIVVMTHSFVWRIYLCDMTHSYVWHDSFIRVWRTRSVRICVDSFIYVTHLYVWHDSNMCMTWLIHTCDMTHSYVFDWPILSVPSVWGAKEVNAHVDQDSFICVAHSYVWHDSNIYITWLIHTCMTDLFSLPLRWVAPKKYTFISVTRLIHISASAMHGAK